MTKVILILSFFLVFNAHAQDTIYIKTSAQCESCKNRLETRLNKTKGVLHTSLNIETKILSVVLDTSLQSLSKIEEKITEIGYDANSKQAKKSAYKRLPACCRKDYTGTH